MGEYLERLRNRVQAANTELGFSIMEIRKVDEYVFMDAEVKVMLEAEALTEEERDKLIEAWACLARAKDAAGEARSHVLDVIYARDEDDFGK
jgi:hypothetical protein